VLLGISYTPSFVSNPLSHVLVSFYEAARPDSDARDFNVVPISHICFWFAIFLCYATILTLPIAYRMISAIHWCL